MYKKYRSVFVILIIVNLLCFKALADPLETLSVSGTNPNPVYTTVPLVVGRSYVIEASGTYIYSIGNAQADAGYATYGNNWPYIRSDIGVHGNPYKGVTSILVDLGSGIQVVDWGNYNSGHVYEYRFTATNASIGFVISDWWSDWYGPSYSYQSGMYDNSGALTVSISIDGCSVAELTPITDPLAQQFEAANGEIVDLEHLDQAILDAVAVFRGNVIDQPGAQTFTITSGYRPTAYQAHLYELNTRFHDLEDLNGITPAIIDGRPQLEVDQSIAEAVACQSLVDEINAEIRTHELVPNGRGAPAVSPPGSSRHETGDAIDIAIYGLDADEIDELAENAGLHRPYGTGDWVHYELSGQPAQIGATIIGNSPINLLVVDPAGKKLGFDWVSGSIVNDFGEFAEYSGPGTEPQVLIIPQSHVIPGTYRISGIGTGEGGFSITAQTTGEQMKLLSETIIASGIAALGEPIDSIEPINLVLVTQLNGGLFDAASAGLEELVNESTVSGGIDNNGIAQSLIQKAQNMARQAETGNLAAAGGIVGAFINEVEAQRGNHIRVEDADRLLAYATVLVEFWSQ